MAQILHHFLHQTLQHIDAIQELTHSPAMARYIQKTWKKILLCSASSQGNREA